MSRTHRIITTVAAAVAVATVAIPSGSAYASTTLHPRSHHVTPYINMYASTSGAAGYYGNSYQPGTTEVAWDKPTPWWSISKCVEHNGHAVKAIGWVRATLPSSSVDVEAQVNIYTGTSCATDVSKFAGSSDKHFTLNGRGTTTDMAVGAANVANPKIDWANFYVTMTDA